MRFEALDIQETGFGTNVGGGVKIDLVGPLRLRLDYRVFKLTDDSSKPTFGVEANWRRSGSMRGRTWRSEAKLAWVCGCVGACLGQRPYST